ncbi:MAG: AbiV family abortive infection protein [Candidatus Thorarchaeota archaeon]|jgi:AbiV family abortive infection protein
MKNREDIINAMDLARNNAYQFLKDSETLAGVGSIGHATSLAILGFEEAHKAYLLVVYLPCFDGLIPDSFRKEVKKQIRDHIYKQKMAINFQAFMSFLIYRQLEGQDKNEFKKKLVAYRESSKRYNPNLNIVKNDGFYVDPFRKSGIWGPMNTSSDELIRAQEALKIHLEMVDSIYNFYSTLDIEIPEDIYKDARKIGFALQKQKIKGPSSFKMQLKKGGTIGLLMREFIDFLEDVYEIKITR